MHTPISNTTQTPILGQDPIGLLAPDLPTLAPNPRSSIEQTPRIHHPLDVQQPLVRLGPVEFRLPIPLHGVRLIQIRTSALTRGRDLPPGPHDLLVEPPCELRHLGGAHLSRRRDLGDEVGDGLAPGRTHRVVDVGAVAGRLVVADDIMALLEVRLQDVPRFGELRRVLPARAREEPVRRHDVGSHGPLDEGVLERGPEGVVVARGGRGCEGEAEVAELAEERGGERLEGCDCVVGREEGRHFEFVAVVAAWCDEEVPVRVGVGEIDKELEVGAQAGEEGSCRDVVAGLEGEERCCHRYFRVHPYDG